MYAKVFVQILDSSIAENWMTRHVFMDFLVLADKDGVVDMTIPAIARRTNAPVEVVQAAIEKLTAPDPDSRSHEEDGRRIVPLDPSRDWGWRVVNYVNYCKLRDEPARKEYMRGYMQERRQREREAKRAAQPTESTDVLADVKPVNSVNLTLAHVPVPVSIRTTATPVSPPAKKVASRIPKDFQVTDAHREFAKKNNTVSPEAEIGHFVDYWTAKAGRDGTKLDWDATFRNWLRNAKVMNGASRPKISAGRYSQAALL